MEYEIGDVVKLDPNCGSYRYLVKHEGFNPDAPYVIVEKNIDGFGVRLYRVTPAMFPKYWYTDDSFQPYDVEETGIDWLAINREFG